MIKTYTFILLLMFFSITTNAQFTDDFSDGDFTNNPTWSGDNSQFIINASGQLQLNSSGTNSSYLSASNNLLSLNNLEWRFFIHQNFAGSSSNFGRVYLVADQSNLKNPLNGYYLQFGEALSNDAVELFRQDGTTPVSVCRGTNAQIASSFSIGIKVTRDNSGLWTLAIDGSGGTTYIVEATGTDVTYNSSTFFGVLCTYTSSNATGFYFDNFNIGAIVVDTVPPQISNLTVINTTSLDVLFTEPVEQLSAETLSNYSVTNGIGTPQTAQRDASNLSLVHLSFTNAFASGITNSLTVNNVKDISGNIILANSGFNFTYVAAVSTDPFDLVINEIMFDPDPPVSLPSAEYVEVFNRSNKTFNLSGWTFSDATSTATFANQTILPGDYIILCSNTNQPLFSPFGITASFSSLPSLNNTGGETLTLTDNNSKIIDQVYYDETFYQDATKKDGGWSIERINSNFTCANKNNWKAAFVNTGGTPGGINSVTGNFQDNVSPTILHACPIDSNHVQVFFSEAIADSALSNINNFTLRLNQSAIFLPLVALPSNDFLSVTLTTPFNIISQTAPIEITINSAVADCPGNAIVNNTTTFQWGQKAVAGDVVINEVLFSAKTGGAEFVELYNNSTKAIDVTDLRITRIDLVTGQPDSPVEISTDCFVLLPQHYLVLTKNPDAVKSQYNNEPNAFIKMSLPDLLTDDDIIVLQNASANVIDQFHYYSTWHFPLLNDLHGVSLERINPNRTTQDQNNWHSASETSGFATPGLRNSQFSDGSNDGSNITIDPEIFSPDNDGTNDVTNISYHFDEPGFTAKVDVFDDRGRLMTHLVKNELLGTDGTWSWNGINDKNEKARIGIYVIYMEAFNLNGDVKKYRKTCVLAGKL